MPHISRHKPEQKIIDDIYTKLLNHLTTKGSAKDRSLLSAELLTKTEKIMFAKRLAIICMLGEGFSFEDIQETLRVSPSTVARMWNAMERGRFKETVRIVKKNKMSALVLSVLATLVTGPRPIHAPRWAWVDDVLK